MDKGLRLRSRSVLLEQGLCCGWQVDPRPREAGERLEEPCSGDSHTSCKVRSAPRRTVLAAWCTGQRLYWRLAACRLQSGPSDGGSGDLGHSGGNGKDHRCGSRHSW